jgi:hypothetical protein
VDFHVWPCKEGDGRICDYFDEDGPKHMVTNFQIATNFELSIDMDVLLFLFSILHP